MNKIEVSAKNVEEALTQAMIDLGTTSDRMEYEVISEGRSGFLGFGSKPAVIKAWIREDAMSAELNSFMNKTPAKADPVPEEKVLQEEKPVVKPAESTETAVDKKTGSTAGTAVSTATVKVAQTPEEFITQVCNAMGLEVSVDSKFDEKENILDINMIGKDMGILIGKRGQTLDSLQYLTGLVANKNHEDYIKVKLDTENYRERRKETLENLARNIAYKVKRTKKPVALEPMNPYERRVIHAALQNDRYVVTRSEGEEPFRHVVISLKRERTYNSRPNGGKGGYNNRYGNSSYNKSKGGYGKRRDYKNPRPSDEAGTEDVKQED